jgi:hypothetical protein
MRDSLAAAFGRSGHSQGACRALGLPQGPRSSGGVRFVRRSPVRPGLRRLVRVAGSSFGSSSSARRGRAARAGTRRLRALLGRAVSVASCVEVALDDVVERGIVDAADRRLFSRAGAVARRQVAGAGRGRSGGVGLASPGDERARDGAAAWGRPVTAGPGRALAGAGDMGPVGGVTGRPRTGAAVLRLVVSPRGRGSAGGGGSGGRTPARRAASSSRGRSRSVASACSLGLAGPRPVAGPGGSVRPVVCVERSVAQAEGGAIPGARVALGTCGRGVAARLSSGSSQAASARGEDMEPGERGSPMSSSSVGLRPRRISSMVGSAASSSSSGTGGGGGA